MGPFVCKPLAITWCSVFHFKETISAIPNNWRRLALCTDSFHVPEIIPGIETASPANFQPYRVYKFSEYPALYTRIEELGLPKTACLLVYASFVLIHGLIYIIPAIAYRWSLKATTIIYLPLIYLVQRRLLAGINKDDALNYLSKDRMERIKLSVPLATVFGMLGWALLAIFANNSWVFRIHWQANPVTAFVLEAFLPSDGQGITLQAWKVAAFVNAILAIGVFILADRARRATLLGPWLKQNCFPVVKAVRLLALPLSLYVIGCSIAIAWRIQIWKVIPPIKEFRWLPF